MTERVSLPAGCYGVTMPDGTKYDAKPGGTVTVEDRHARQISKSSNARNGIINKGGVGYTLGTHAGRRCVDCSFLGQAWACVCPRCGGETEPE